MKNRPVVNWLAGAVLIASLAALGLHQQGTPPPVDRRIHEAVGQALARQAVELLGPGGTVTALTRDTASFPQPAIDLSRGAFEKELRRAKVTLQTVQTFEEDPLRPVQVPPGDFFERLRRSRAGDVIVSFLGPPLLLEEQQAGLGAVAGKVVAFCPGDLPRQIDLRLLAQQNLLHAAVLARPRSDIRPGADTFDALYVVAQGAQLTGPGSTGDPRPDTRRP